MTENVDYFFKDFNGEIRWKRMPDGKFAVDPLYIEQFLKKKESRT